MSWRAPSTLPRRVARYTLAGLLFGVMAWYLPDVLNALIEAPGIDVTNPWARLALDLPAYGIWLLLPVGTAWSELRSGGDRRSTALAAALAWLMAITGYYLTWAVLLLSGNGGPQLVVRLDEGWDVYRADVAVVSGVLGDIRREFLFWAPVAAIAGLFTGWFLAEVHRQFRDDAPAGHGAVTPSRRPTRR